MSTMIEARDLVKIYGDHGRKREDAAGPKLRPAPVA